MLEFSNIGKSIIFAGIVLIIVGLIFMFFGKLGLGKLPGDIAIKKGNFAFYFPIVTCIVISIILTIVLNLIKKIF